MPPRRIVVSLHSISTVKSPKRYTRSVQRNLRNSNEKQNLCNGLRYLAWAYCIFFFQGNSQDLFAGSGIRRHASFIINARRGAGGQTKEKEMILEAGWHWEFNWGAFIIFLIAIVILAYFLAFPLLIAKAAKNRGRSGTLWFFLSILFSPLLVILLLIAMGDTDAKRKEKWMHEEMMRRPLQPQQPDDRSKQENERLKMLLAKSRKS